MRDRVNSETPAQGRCVVLMLLTNAYEPDPRVRQEALALIDAGFRVKLLAWDRDHRSRESEQVEGVEVTRVFLRSTHGRGTSQIFYYARLYLKMLRLGWRTDFDAIHCHDLDTLPIGWLLGVARRKPVVYDAHESFPDMLAGSVPVWLRRMLVRLENFLICRVDLLITVGEKLRRHFDERGARHSATVGNWKDPRQYARTVEQNLEVRRTLGIPDAALAICCITQLLTDRKLSEFLDAVDASPGVYAVVGGRGVLEQAVRERAARNPRIVFLGFVRPDDIPAYTCAADVIYYGFDVENPNARFSAPNKLYEALAAGRPLITGDFGEIADVVRRESCGIVLPSYAADEIRKAIRELCVPERCRQMAQRAAHAGRGMSWQRGKEVLYGEYSRLLPKALSPGVLAGTPSAAIAE